MSAQHTPGPWHIGRESNHSADRWARRGEWARIRGENDGLIAKVESIHPKGHRKSADFDTEAANAALIAAAPELLEALELIEASGTNDAEILRRYARAAIAKARGRL